MEIELLRQKVLAALAAAGFTDLELAWESPLVADGHFFGRRFEFDGLRAFWFRSRRVVELYNEHWQLLLELPLESASDHADAA